MSKLLQRSRVRLLGEIFILYVFFHADTLGRQGSTLVFIVPLGTSYVQ